MRRQKLIVMMQGGDKRGGLMTDGRIGFAYTSCYAHSHPRCSTCFGRLPCCLCGFGHGGQGGQRHPRTNPRVEHHQGPGPEVW
jgi:hypothetical protein